MLGFAHVQLNIFGFSVLPDDHAGIDALAAFIKECGLPSHLTELKMKDSPEKLLTDRALEEIAYSTTILPGSYKRMTGSEIYEIFKECM